MYQSCICVLKAPVVYMCVKGTSHVCVLKVPVIYMYVKGTSYVYAC